MQDDGYIPPMNPDDFAALAAVAGPMFQQSRLIEQYCSESPIPGGNKEFGSMSIKRSLENAQQLARDSAYRQHAAQYVAPADTQYLQAVPLPIPTHYNEPTTTPVHVHTPQVNFAPSSDTNQLELNFSRTDQAITNDLLREISKKLTVLINLIDKTESEATLPKSNPKKHNVSHPTQNNKPTPV
jgi:hypothetical protein